MSEGRPRASIDYQFGPTPLSAGNIKDRWVEEIYYFLMVCIEEKQTMTVMASGRIRWSTRLAILLMIILLCGRRVYGYPVLTHEEIVDLVWADEIRHLVLQRFPGQAEEKIMQTHAYAYGGAVIQDLGYYPLGSAEFSNLYSDLAASIETKKTGSAGRTR